MAIEMRDLPIENSDFTLFFVCLPEGIYGGLSWMITIHEPGNHIGP